MEKIFEMIEIIKKNLPESSLGIRKVIQELLNEVEFVIESFENNGDLPPQMTEIFENLETLYERLDLGYGQLHLLDGIPENTKRNRVRPDYKNYIVDETIPHNLTENLTHIKPYGYRFKRDEIIEANSWKSLYIKACEEFYRINPDKFLSFKNKTYMNGESREYFSEIAENLDEPHRLQDKLFISTKFDANSVRDLLTKIIKELDLSTEDFKLYFRADYNRLHRL